MYLSFTRLTRNLYLPFIRGNILCFSTESKRQLDLVKNLRKLTNEGVTSCKKALVENNWDINRAAVYILGNQQRKRVEFEEDKLNFGKVSLSFTQKRDRTVAVDLRTDCDIVAATKLFEDVCKQVSDSVLAFLDLQTPEFFSNKPHIFSINNTDLDYIPIQHSNQDTLGSILKRVSSQFGKPVIAESIYVCHNKEGDFIGSYTHNTLPSSSEQTFVAKRVGIASIKCDCAEYLKSDLNKFGDLIALQAVADPNFCSLDEFLSLKLLKYDEFNHMLTHLSDNVNKLKGSTDSKITQVRWTQTNANTTVKEALELVKFLNIPEITINALLYINAGKESVLINNSTL